MNLKDNTINIKGPSIIRPSKKYKIKFLVKGKEKAYYLTKLSILRPLNINYPLAPLDWDNRDQGLTEDKNWQLHYYELGNIEKGGKTIKEIEFISNPRGKLRFFIISASFAGYTDREHKNWAEVAMENKIILYVPKITCSFSFIKYAKKPMLTPKKLVPSHSEVKENGWELIDSSLPPLKEIDGYKGGIVSKYRVTVKNVTKTIIVGVYEFGNKKYADKYFDRQCDGWLDMHRSSSETIKIREIMKSQGIIWTAKNGVICNWGKDNLIFSIYGIMASVLDVEDFIKTINDKI